VVLDGFEVVVDAGFAMVLDGFEVVVDAGFAMVIDGFELVIVVCSPVRRPGGFIE
jgi:hypothetical protein